MKEKSLLASYTLTAQRLICLGIEKNFKKFNLAE
jgi:hypothetical protein